MSEIDREKFDAAEAPTEEFDAIEVEPLEREVYVIDKHRLWLWLILFAVFLVAFSGVSEIFQDAVAWIVAVIVAVVLVAAVFIAVVHVSLRSMTPR